MLYMLIQVCDDIMDMARHIHDMRVYIRKEESDIRSNNKICAKLWTFIDTIMNEYDNSPPPPARTGRPNPRKKARDESYVPSKPQKRVRISEK